MCDLEEIPVPASWYSKGMKPRRLSVLTISAVKLHK